MIDWDAMKFYQTSKLCPSEIALPPGVGDNLTRLWKPPTGIAQCKKRDGHWGRHVGRIGPGEYMSWGKDEGALGLTDAARAAYIQKQKDDFVAQFGEELFAKFADRYPA